MLTYFVTLNWNTTGLLKELAKSVEMTTLEAHRWVIVDNGSNETNRRELVGFLNETEEDIAAVLFNRENLGCVKAHNASLDLIWALSEEAEHEVVLIDTDVTVGEFGWLSKIWAWADDKPQVGIVSLEHGPNDKCGPAVFLDDCGNWYLYERQLQAEEACEGESGGFGFALLRWPVLAHRIRFDTGFLFYYKQDDDFCFQVRSLGLEIWAYPVGNVHFGCGSLRANEWKLGEAQEQDEVNRLIKSVNQAYFVRKWRWALDKRRGSLEEERKHLDRMRAVLRAGPR